MSSVANGGENVQAWRNLTLSCIFITQFPSSAKNQKAHQGRHFGRVQQGRRNAEDPQPDDNFYGNGAAKVNVCQEGGNQ
jgi:hypothetical protein